MPLCKPKKKGAAKSKEPSKAKKSAEEPPSRVTAASSAAAPTAPAAVPSASAASPGSPATGRISAFTKPADRREVERKKPKRNYFKGDEHFRTIVAQGLTTIAGGEGGSVPMKDDSEHEKKVAVFFENWHLQESYYLQECGQEGGLKPDEEQMKKNEEAQKRMWELEKKFGEKMLVALTKGQMSGNQTPLAKMEDHRETPSAEDPRYEAQWW